MRLKLHNQHQLETDTDGKTDNYTFFGGLLESIVTQAQTTYASDQTTSLDELIKNSLNSTSPINFKIVTESNKKTLTITGLDDGDGANGSTITFIDDENNLINNNLYMKYTDDSNKTWQVNISLNDIITKNTTDKDGKLTFNVSDSSITVQNYELS